MADLAASLPFAIAPEPSARLDHTLAASLLWRRLRLLHLLARLLEHIAYGRHEALRRLLSRRLRYARACPASRPARAVGVTGVRSRGGGTNRSMPGTPRKSDPQPVSTYCCTAEKPVETVQ